MPFGFDFFDLFFIRAKNYDFLAVAMKTAVGIFMKFDLVRLYADTEVMADFADGSAWKKAEKKAWRKGVPNC